CPSLHQNYTVAEIARLLTRVRCKALFAQPGYGADSDRNSIFDAGKGISTLGRIYALAPQGPEGQGVTMPEGTLPFPERSSLNGVTSAPIMDPDKVVYPAF